MRYLSLSEVLELHHRLLLLTGGAGGIRDLGALESAVAQPRMTFEGNDLYPDLVTKAAALGFSLIQNHAFVDGNKRVSHAAVETFLMLNGHQLTAAVDDGEAFVLGLAAGELGRAEFETWLRKRMSPYDGSV